jgi:predicted extracellular nuclease
VPGIVTGIRTVQRAGQAQVVHDFVGTILDVDRKADVVVLGDLNDFQFSPSVRRCGRARPTARVPRS